MTDQQGFPLHDICEKWGRVRIKQNSIPEGISMPGILNVFIYYGSLREQKKAYKIILEIYQDGQFFPSLTDNFCSFYSELKINLMNHGITTFPTLRFFPFYKTSKYIPEGRDDISKINTSRSTTLFNTNSPLILYKSAFHEM